MAISLFGFEIADTRMDPNRKDYGFWLASFKLNQRNPRALLGIHWDKPQGLVLQLLFMNLGR